jgi:fluoride exporter
MPLPIWIAFAGAAGTLARYGLGSLVNRLTPGGLLPWGTLAVNLAGCFLYGLVWAALSAKLRINERTSQVLLIGFMGGFTTFSSLISEAHTLFAAGQWRHLTAHLAVQIMGGLAALMLGLRLGHRL